jgi:hypothetical protein
MLSGYNLEDKAITILSSGFMDPSMNSFGPEFGLFWTTASGGNLIPFPSITTGIADYKTDIFKMYPNPANEFTTISINRDTGEEINIQLLDINGKLVKDFGTHKSNAGEIKLNISDIPEGNYSVLSKTKSFTSTKKLLIIR